MSFDNPANQAQAVSSEASAASHALFDDIRHSLPTVSRVDFSNGGGEALPGNQQTLWGMASGDALPGNMQTTLGMASGDALPNGAQTAVSQLTQYQMHPFNNYPGKQG